MKNKKISQNLINEVIKLLKEQKYQNVIVHEKKFDFDKLENALLIYLFGTNRLALNDLNLAETYLLKSIKINDKLGEAYSNLGILYEKQKKFDSALKFLKKSIKIKPKYYEAHFNIATLYAKQEEYEKAITYFLKALKINKNFNLLRNLAKTYFNLKQYEKSYTYNQMALDFEPNDNESLNRHGTILINQEKYEEALEFYKKLIKIIPNSAEVYFNLGISYRGLNQIEDEIQSYRKALIIDQNSPEPNHNLSLYLLREGNFREGWSRHEHRLNVTHTQPIKRPDTNLPFWNPNCKDSRLFVWPEQGVGDVIFFASLLPEIRKHCKSITCAIDKRLLNLFKRSMPEITFVPINANLFNNQFDHQLPIGSIPQFFRNDIEDFKKTPLSYLKADLKKSLKLEKEIENTKKFTIGISWKSKSTAGNDKNIDLINLVKFMKIPAKFVSLQYGDVDEEIREVKEKTGVDIIQCKSLDIYNDLDGLASLMCACDIVVTIPNVNQTIASGLGIPTFVLVSNNPSFRWLNNGIDTIWHPNTKVFRQTSNGNWEKPINEMSQIIISLISQLYQTSA